MVDPDRVAGERDRVVERGECRVVRGMERRCGEDGWGRERLFEHHPHLRSAPLALLFGDGVDMALAVAGGVGRVDAVGGGDAIGLKRIDDPRRRAPVGVECEEEEQYRPCDSFHRSAEDTERGGKMEERGWRMED